MSNICVRIQILWGNRHIQDQGNHAKVSVDGTDCPIQETSPFDPTLWSHKLNAAGLRYKVAGLDDKQSLQQLGFGAKKRKVSADFELTAMSEGLSLSHTANVVVAVEAEFLVEFDSR